MSRYVSKTNRRVKREWDWREFDVMEEMDPPVQVSRVRKLNVNVRNKLNNLL